MREIAQNTLGSKIANIGRRIAMCLFGLMLTTTISATDYYVATTGSDSNAGTIEAPFASLSYAQMLVQAGDNVYFRGGTYEIGEEQIMEYTSNGLWAYVFKIATKGTSNKPIVYAAYGDEKVIFDMSTVKPTNRRVIVFYVSGSYLTFKNFEVIGTQVTILEHTQSECFRIEGGNYNTFENISCHDGMAIGYYLIKGMYNLILNCDAYNNYDSVSESGTGGNVDGFGGHTNSTGSVGNVFRGCRAWYNSDDGFDLINCQTSITIEDCWSFRNGYQAVTNASLGDGTGFKAGGYGMTTSINAPTEIPRHVVRNCIAYFNKNKGFYANHHLGGIDWYNNTGYQNPSNFCMLNRKSVEGDPENVDGYGHVLENNLSYSPRTTDAHIISVDMDSCQLKNNSFFSALTLSDADFVSLDESQLVAARKVDGSLPDITFLQVNPNSLLAYWKLGYYEDAQDNTTYNWMEQASIDVDGNYAKVVGAGAEAFVNFYVDDTKVDFSKRLVDLSTYEGTITLKATTEEGGITQLIINK